MATPWIKYAQSLIGTKEVPGPGNNPIIVNMLIQLKAWWREDIVPWCGVFAGYCLMQSGLKYPKEYYRAKEWLNWGVALSTPVYGCIVVFNRAGGGHVGFVVGKDTQGRLLVLGGNQGDKVSIAPFDMSRVAGYRYPSEVPFTLDALPIMSSAADSSTNEA